MGEKTSNCERGRKDMIVKLFDKTEIVVTGEQAEKIKTAVANGVKHISINENWITTSSISSIIQGGETKEYGDYQIDRKHATNRLLGSGDNRGNPSPIKESIKAKIKAGKTWSQIAKEL